MLNFAKMHGCGNDYIYFDCFHQKISDPEALSRRLSDRRFGIGGDGIILVCPSDVADMKMLMFNADGSQGRMCGNGIRCAGKFAFDHKLVKGREITVETLAGIKRLEFTLGDDGKVSSVLVNMGKPIFDPRNIPADCDADRAIKYPAVIAGNKYIINLVSVGSPHCVVFTHENFSEDFDLYGNFQLEKIGPAFENDSFFPDRVNTEFVEYIDEKNLRFRVWERGSGETWACGTGSCASVVAAVENGLCSRGEWINVILRGGNLRICYENDGYVLMDGPAVTVFEGTVEE